MKSRWFYRWALATMAGGTLFQAASSCSNDVSSTMATSLMPSLTSALTAAITGATTCDTSAGTGTATSDATSLSTSGSNAFNAVGGAIQNAQSGFDFVDGSSSNSGSSGTGG